MEIQKLSETALLTLRARAVASNWNPYFVDDKAKDWVEQLYDNKTKVQAKTPIESVVRAQMIDEVVEEILKNSSGETILVNLGCGFCTLYHRLKNKPKLTIEIDVPEVLEIKKILQPESDQILYISADLKVFDLKNLPPDNGQKVIFVLEGLLHYFDYKEVQKILLDLSLKYSHCDIIFDAYSARSISTLKMLFSKKQAASFLKWGMRNIKDFDFLDYTQMHSQGSILKRASSYFNGFKRLIMSMLGSLNAYNVFHFSFQNRTIPLKKRRGWAGFLSSIATSESTEKVVVEPLLNNFSAPHIQNLIQTQFDDENRHYLAFRDFNFNFFNYSKRHQTITDKVIYEKAFPLIARLGEKYPFLLIIVLNFYENFSIQIYRELKRLAKVDGLSELETLILDVEKDEWRHLAGLKTLSLDLKERNYKVKKTELFFAHLICFILRIDVSVHPLAIFNSRLKRNLRGIEFPLKTMKEASRTANTRCNEFIKDFVR